eukprot:Nk52_evm4s285 gene=Nk52_evmTU4s285
MKDNTVQRRMSNVKGVLSAVKAKVGARRLQDKGNGDFPEPSFKGPKSDIRLKIFLHDKSTKTVMLSPEITLQEVLEDYVADYCDLEKYTLDMSDRFSNILDWSMDSTLDELNCDELAVKPITADYQTYKDNPLRPESYVEYICRILENPLPTESKDLNIFSELEHYEPYDIVGYDLHEWLSKVFNVDDELVEDTLIFEEQKRGEILWDELQRRLLQFLRMDNKVFFKSEAVYYKYRLDVIEKSYQMMELLRKEGKIIVIVKSVKDLIGQEERPGGSVYCTVTFGSKCSKTKAIDRIPVPIWNHEIRFYTDGSCDDDIEIAVYASDHQDEHDEFLGKIQVRLKLLPYANKEFILEPRDHMEPVSGTITLDVCYSKILRKEISEQLKTQLDQRARESKMRNRRGMRGLHIEIIGCMGLSTLGGKPPNPFVSMKLNTEANQTTTLKKCTNPVFEEGFNFSPTSDEDILHIFVYDEKTSLALGQVTVNLANYEPNGPDIETTFDLKPCPDMPEPTGKVHVNMRYSKLVSEKDIKRGEEEATEEIDSLEELMEMDEENIVKRAKDGLWSFPSFFTIKHVDVKLNNMEMFQQNNVSRMGKKQMSNLENVKETASSKTKVMDRQAVSDDDRDSQYASGDSGDEMGHQISPDVKSAYEIDINQDSDDQEDCSGVSSIEIGSDLDMSIESLDEVVTYNYSRESTAKSSTHSIVSSLDISIEDIDEKVVERRRTIVENASDSEDEKLEDSHASSDFSGSGEVRRDDEEEDSEDDEEEEFDPSTLRHKPCVLFEVDDTVLKTSTICETEIYELAWEDKLRLPFFQIANFLKIRVCNHDEETEDDFDYFETYGAVEISLRWLIEKGMSSNSCLPLFLNDELVGEINIEIEFIMNKHIDFLGQIYFSYMDINEEENCTWEKIFCAVVNMGINTFIYHFEPVNERDVFRKVEEKLKEDELEDQSDEEFSNSEDEDDDYADDIEKFLTPVTPVKTVEVKPVTFQGWLLQKGLSNKSKEVRRRSTLGGLKRVFRKGSVYQRRYCEIKENMFNIYDQVPVDEKTRPAASYDLRRLGWDYDDKKGEFSLQVSDLGEESDIVFQCELASSLKMWKRGIKRGSEDIVRAPQSNLMMMQQAVIDEDDSEESDKDEGGVYDAKELFTDLPDLEIFRFKKVTIWANPFDVVVKNGTKCVMLKREQQNDTDFLGGEDISDATYLSYKTNDSKTFKQFVSVTKKIGTDIKTILKESFDETEKEDNDDVQQTIIQELQKDQPTMKISHYKIYRRIMFQLFDAYVEKKVNSEQPIIENIDSASSKIMNLFARRYFVDDTYISMTYFVLLANSCEKYQVDLKVILDAFKKLSSAVRKSQRKLTAKNKDMLQKTLSRYVEYLTVLVKNYKNTFPDGKGGLEECIKLLTLILECTMYRQRHPDAPFFAELVTPFLKETTTQMYHRISEENSPEGCEDTSVKSVDHLIMITNNIVDEMKSDSAHFKSAFLPAVDIISLNGEVYMSFLKHDILNGLRSCNDLENKAVFGIYENMKYLASTFGKYCPCFKEFFKELLPVMSPFAIGYIDKTERDIHAMAVACYKNDDWVHEGQGMLNSSSAHDLFVLMMTNARFVLKLEWEEPFLANHLFTSLTRIICETAAEYAAMLKDELENEIKFYEGKQAAYEAKQEESSDSESEDEEYDENGCIISTSKGPPVFEVSVKHCILISNVRYMKSHLEILYKELDVDTIIASELERTKSLLELNLQEVETSKTAQLLEDTKWNVKALLNDHTSNNEEDSGDEEQSNCWEENWDPSNPQSTLSSTKGVDKESLDSNVDKRSTDTSHNIIEESEENRDEVENENAEDGREGGRDLESEKRSLIEQEVPKTPIPEKEDSIVEELTPLQAKPQYIPKIRMEFTKAEQLLDEKYFEVMATWLIEKMNDHVRVPLKAFLGPPHEHTTISTAAWSLISTHILKEKQVDHGHVDTEEVSQHIEKLINDVNTDLSMLNKHIPTADFDVLVVAFWKKGIAQTIHDTLATHKGRQLSIARKHALDKMMLSLTELFYLEGDGLPMHFIKCKRYKQILELIQLRTMGTSELIKLYLEMEKPGRRKDILRDLLQGREGDTLMQEFFRDESQKMSQSELFVKYCTIAQKEKTDNLWDIAIGSFLK